MTPAIGLTLTVFFIYTGILYTSPYQDDKIINDYNFKFTFKLSGEWETRDLKETSDKDGISYAFEKKNKKLFIQLLAFKLSSVKNIDDFIYNIEKDISLNIPQRSGEYQEQDFGKYDMKNALYRDNKYTEKVYYFRTKLPDSANNYVYMLRFISENKDFDSAVEKEIETIASGFASFAE